MSLDSSLIPKGETTSFLVASSFNSANPLLDGLFNGIIYVNHEDDVSYVNPALIKMVGAAQEDFTDCTLVSLATSGKEALKHLAKILIELKLQNSTSPLKDTDFRESEKLKLQIRLVQVVDELNSPAGFAAICQEVRQPIETLDQYSNTEHFLDTIIQHLPNMVFVKEAKNLSFVRMNKAGEELIGLKESELLGKSDFDFFPKTEAEFFTQKDREVIQDGGIVDIPVEKISTNKKGERWLHTKKVPIYSIDGKPLYLLGISEDITERIETEQSLHQQLKLENLIASISASFINVSRSKIDKTIQESLELMGSVAEVDRATIYIENDGVIRKKFGWFNNPEDSTRNLELEFSLKDFKWLLKQVEKQGYFYMPSLNALPASAKNERKAFSELDIQSSLILPLKTKGQSLGYMILNQVDNQRAFERDQIALYLIASQIFANGIQQRQDEIRLANRFKLEQIVTKISTRFINIHKKSISVEFRKALKKVRQSLEIEDAWLFMVDAGSDMIRLVASAQKTIQTGENSFSQEVDQLLGSTIGSIKKANGPLLISLKDKGNKHRKVKLALNSLEMTELLLCPVWINPNETCCLAFVSKSKRVFEPDTISLLRTLSKIFSNTIDNLRYERRLEESRELYRTLADNIPESSVLLFDRDLTYLVVEGAGLEQQGYSRDSLENKTIYEVMDEVNLPVFEPLYNKVFNGEASRMEKQFGDRHFKIDILPVRNDKGHIFAGMFMSFDITELKQFEATLKTQAMELKRSNQDLEMFAYAASHDLREPLRMISNYVDLIDRYLAEHKSNEVGEFMEFVLDGVGRMQSLIDDLLAYARVDQRKMQRKDIDSEMCLAVALKNLESIINETEAEIRWSVLPKIHADSRQIVSLFQNLISNSLRFHGPEKPTITIDFSENNDNWMFKVKDEGIGIEKEFLDRIFVVFQRLHSRSDYPGTGIGLAMCKKIIEQHNGNIWADSEPGKGTTFCFTISKQIIE